MCVLPKYSKSIAVHGLKMINEAVDANFKGNERIPIHAISLQMLKMDDAYVLYTILEHLQEFL